MIFGPGFQGISSAKRPRKPRERPFASPQAVRPAADHLPVCNLCEQPQREMETRLDYRERSRRVTSWSHNSSLLGLGLSLSVLWPGCSGLLPNLFSSSLSPLLLFSTVGVYPAVLLLLLTCTLPTGLTIAAFPLRGFLVMTFEFIKRVCDVEK